MMPTNWKPTMSGRLVIHIGLPRNANTLIKKDIYTVLANHSGWSYDYTGQKAYILDELIPYMQTGRKPKRIRKQSGNTLFASESLTGYNPGAWDELFEFCKRVFPASAEILISVREPLNWMRSVYYEAVGRSQMNFAPKDFFVSSETYEEKKKALGRFAEYSGLFFSLEDFCVNRLYAKYNRHFSKVTLVDYEMITRGEFYQSYFNLDDNVTCEISRLFNTKRANSSLAKNVLKKKLAKGDSVLQTDIHYNDHYMLTKIIRGPNTSGLTKQKRTLVSLAKSVLSPNINGNGLINGFNISEFDKQITAAFENSPMYKSDTLKR